MARQKSDTIVDFTDEQLYEMPTTPKLIEIYMEDKYFVKKNPDVDFDSLKAKLNDNCHYCLSKKSKIKENRCMCEEFRNTDCEGPCSCGLYIKELKPESEFKKSRMDTLSRGKNA